MLYKKRSIPGWVFLDDISPLLTIGRSWEPKAAARYVLDSLAPFNTGGCMAEDKRKDYYSAKRG
jgi:hypothetical protein